MRIRRRQRRVAGRFASRGGDGCAGEVTRPRVKRPAFTFAFVRSLRLGPIHRLNGRSVALLLGMVIARGHGHRLMASEVIDLFDGYNAQNPKGQVRALLTGNCSCRLDGRNQFARLISSDSVSAPILELNLDRIQSRHIVEPPASKSSDTPTVASGSLAGRASVW